MVQRLNGCEWCRIAGNWARARAPHTRRRHLRKLGYKLVVVNYWEWDALRDSNAAGRRAFLRRKLFHAGASDDDAQNDEASAESDTN